MIFTQFQILYNNLHHTFKNCLKGEVLRRRLNIYLYFVYLQIDIGSNFDQKVFNYIFSQKL